MITVALFVIVPNWTLHKYPWPLDGKEYAWFHWYIKFKRGKTYGLWEVRRVTPKGAEGGFWGAGHVVSSPDNCYMGVFTLWKFTDLHSYHLCPFQYMDYFLAIKIIELLNSTQMDFKGLMLSVKAISKVNKRCNSIYKTFSKWQNYMDLEHISLPRVRDWRELEGRESRMCNCKGTAQEREQFCTLIAVVVTGIYMW